MKLPATTVIAPEKATEYLLIPQYRGDKSKFLAHAGYVFEHPERLLADLRSQILPMDALPLESGPFGLLRNSRRTHRA